MGVLSLPNILQSTPYDCGDAAMQTVLQYHKIVAPSRLASPIEGLDPVSLERHLRHKLGLLVSAGSMTVVDLKHYCDVNRPPIALVTWPEDDDESHWVVVRGVSRGRVYIQDPADGPQNVRIDAWEAMWHGDGRMGEQYRQWSVVGWPRIIG